MVDEKRATELVERLGAYYRKALKKKTPAIARNLDLKKKVTLFGIDFFCWKELITYGSGKYIQEWCPNSDVEVELDGNDSVLTLRLDDRDEEVLSRQIDLLRM